MLRIAASGIIKKQSRTFATVVPAWFFVNMNPEERYAVKVQQKLQKMGFGSIDEFKRAQDRMAKDRAARHALSLRRAGDVMDPLRIPEVTPQRNFATMPDRLSASKPLNAILRMDKVKDQDAETIGTLWKRYHADKDLLCAVIPVETYDKMMANGEKYPIFLLPLPRDNDGVEFFVLQFSPPAVLFVSLHEYQQLGPARAKPALRLEHFTELAADKKIVLMRGEVDDSLLGRTLTLADAQILALSMQTYYVNPNSRKQALLDALAKYVNASACVR